MSAAPKTLKSKLAVVNAKGQLMCQLCNAEVKSEAVWTAHVNGRLHRENAAALKQKAAGGAKRAAPVSGISASTIAPKKSKGGLPGEEETVDCAAPLELESAGGSGMTQELATAHEEAIEEVVSAVGSGDDVGWAPPLDGVFVLPWATWRRSCWPNPQGGYKDGRRALKAGWAEAFEEELMKVNPACVRTFAHNRVARLGARVRSAAWFTGRAVCKHSACSLTYELFVDAEPTPGQPVPVRFQGQGLFRHFPAEAHRRPLVGAKRRAVMAKLSGGAEAGSVALESQARLDPIAWAYGNYTAAPCRNSLYKVKHEAKSVGPLPPEASEDERWELFRLLQSQKTELRGLVLPGFLQSLSLEPFSATLQMDVQLRYCLHVLREGGSLVLEPQETPLRLAASTRRLGELAAFAVPAKEPRASSVGVRWGHEAGKAPVSQLLAEDPLNAVHITAWLQRLRELLELAGRGGDAELRPAAVLSDLIWPVLSSASLAFNEEGLLSYAHWAFALATEGLPAAEVRTKTLLSIPRRHFLARLAMRLPSVGPDFGAGDRATFLGWASGLAASGTLEELRAAYREIVVLISSPTLTPRASAAREHVDLFCDAESVSALDADFNERLTSEPRPPDDEASPFRRQLSLDHGAASREAAAEEAAEANPMHFPWLADVLEELTGSAHLWSAICEHPLRYTEESETSSPEAPSTTQASVAEPWFRFEANSIFPTQRGAPPISTIQYVQKVLDPIKLRIGSALMLSRGLESSPMLTTTQRRRRPPANLPSTVPHSLPPQTLVLRELGAAEAVYFEDDAGPINVVEETVTVDGTW